MFERRIKMFHIYDAEMDRQLRIRFYKTWVDQELGGPCPPRYTTVCEIQDENTKKVIFTGYAHLHPKDTPDKIIGKKVALTNAMIKERVELSDNNVVVHWNFPKHVRTDIWETFWEWVGNWNPERLAFKVWLKTNEAQRKSMIESIKEFLNKKEQKP